MVLQEMSVREPGSGDGSSFSSVKSDVKMVMLGPLFWGRCSTAGRGEVSSGLKQSLVGG